MSFYCTLTDSQLSGYLIISHSLITTHVENPFPLIGHGLHCLANQLFQFMAENQILNIFCRRSYKSVIQTNCTDIPVTVPIIIKSVLGRLIDISIQVPHPLQRSTRNPQMYKSILCQILRHFIVIYHTVKKSSPEDNRAGTRHRKP